MEKTPINLDTELLASSASCAGSPAEHIKLLVTKTADMLTHTQLDADQKVKHFAVLLEAQLRLRALASQPQCTEVLTDITREPAGLCSGSVLVQTLDQLAANKQI